jgi:hypothetical protein
VVERWKRGRHHTLLEMTGLITKHRPSVKASHASICVSNRGGAREKCMFSSIRLCLGSIFI